MSNLRDSAWEWPDDDPRVDAAEAARLDPPVEVFWPVEGNYPEGWAEPR